MGLTVFLTSGQTFTFHGVEILTDNESVICFTYEAQSDGRWKTATFYKKVGAVAGISLFDEGSEE